MSTATDQPEQAPAAVRDDGGGPEHGPMGTSPAGAPASAWIGLVALTFLSLWLVSSLPHRTWIAVAVAAIAWVKAWMVARSFLESWRAGPLFAGVVRLFIALAPLGLVLTAWLEHAPAR